MYIIYKISHIYPKAQLDTFTSTPELLDSRTEWWRHLRDISGMRVHTGL